MKKKLLFITMLFGLILIPKAVLAASLGLNCPSSVIAGENITCTLTASHESISGVKGSISYSGMSYQSVSNLTGSNYFSVTSSGFDGAIDIVSGSKSLAKYVFATSSEGTATINVACSEIIDGTNFDTHSCSGASKTITIKAKTQPTTQPSNPTPSNPAPQQPSNNNQSQNTLSKNNNLKSLTVEGYELEKVDNKNYLLSVPNNITSININAVAEDSKAKVSSLGVKELQVGENIIEIIIKAENGSQNKITIKVTRKDGYYLEDLDSILKDAQIKNADIILNADSLINVDQIKKIKDSKKELRFNYLDENKKLLYSWFINGNEIDESNEFSTTITFPIEKVKEIYKLSNYADGLYLNFKHEGDLPYGTKVKIFVGDKFENENIVHLYHYNTTNKTLDIIKKDIKVIDGYIEFDIEHCSDYFVTMSTIGNNVEVKETENVNIFMILTIILIITIIGLIMFIIIKFKSNKKDNSKIELTKTLETNSNDNCNLIEEKSELNINFNNGNILNSDNVIEIPKTLENNNIDSLNKIEEKQEINTDFNNINSLQNNLTGIQNSNDSNNSSNNFYK